MRFFHRLIIIRLFTLIMCLPTLAQAEILVLVQGFLATGNDWRGAGVTETLYRGGWTDGGHLTLQSGGIRLQRSSSAIRSSHRFYTLEITTHAPLLHQAKQLAGYIGYLTEQFPGEGIILAGHSAGGVVARVYMVQHPQQAIAALITIASPHLGSHAAKIGSMIGQSPLGWIAPMLGQNELLNAQGLVQDLNGQQPGSLLFWLNQQEHPPSRYISLVRKDDDLLGIGDIIVPAWSQDMNNIFALRGRSSRILVGNGHGLSETDGTVLLQILSWLSRT